jgi:membrane protease YdiL (CAAX protease family)
MNDEEIENHLNKNGQKTSNNNKKSNLQKEDWSFCPVCGNELPKIKNLQFCIKCRTNITYLKEHKKFPPEKISNLYRKPISNSQYVNQYVIYGSPKISEDKITNTQDIKLWKTSISIGLPIIAYISMNFVAAIFIVLIVSLNFGLENIIDIAFNPYFIAVTSLFELIFILFPVLYVGQYLQTPSLKNRFELLGFTTKGFERKKTIKEIFIGIVFAIIGVILVVGVSILIEIILELAFGVEILRDVNSGITDAELIVSDTDIIGLIVLVLVMILIIGTSEEVLFRGFMQKGLMRNLGIKRGIILSAFIFAMFHLIGFFLFIPESSLIFIVSFLLAFFPYFAISLMIGWIFYWRKENLLAVMVCHGVYDALTIILAFIAFNVF